MGNARILLLTIAVALAGCGGAPGSASDPIQIYPDSSGNADFIAVVPNQQSLIFNGSLRADRISVVGSRLKSMGCRDPRMLRESAENEGGNRVVYYSAWKCA